MSIYEVENSQGRRVKFEWLDPSPPTEEDLDDVFGDVLGKPTMYEPETPPEVSNFQKIRTTSEMPGRGLLQWIASTPQWVGGLIKEAGNQAEKSPAFWEWALTPQLSAGKAMRAWQAERSNLDEKIADIGHDMIMENREWIESKPYLQSEEGKLNEFMFALGSGVGSLAGALGLAYLTKRTDVAAMAFGVMAKGHTYQRALEAGRTSEEASLLSSAHGVGEAALENLGLRLIFGKYAGRLIPSMMTEGIQEMSQEVWGNLVAKLGIDRAQAIFENVATSGLIGFILGGGASVVTKALGNTESGKVLTESGVDIGNIVTRMEEEFAGYLEEIKHNERGTALIPEMPKKPKVEVPAKPVPEVAKEPWQMTKEEFEYDFRTRIEDQVTSAWAGGKKQIKVARQIAIIRALKEGKPVPTEVLAEYPELTKPAPAKEIPAVKPEVEGAIPKELDAPKVGDSYKIDGDEVIFFNKEITMGGDVSYYFTDDLKSGRATHELTQSQFFSMIDEGRIVPPIKPTPTTPKVEPLAVEARKYKTAEEFVTQVRSDIEKRNAELGRPGVPGWGGVAIPRSVQREFDKSLAKRVMDAGIKTDIKSLKSFYTQVTKPTPPAKEVAGVPVEKITIRKSTYRGEEGYTVRGKKADIFVKTRHQAEELKELLKSPLTREQRETGISRILREKPPVKPVEPKVEPPVIEKKVEVKPAEKVAKKKLTRIEKVAKLSVEEVKKEKRLTTLFLYHQAREIYDEAKNLKQAIMSEGGIRSYAKSEYGFVPELEEYQVIHRDLRRKKGLPLDEMADVLKNYGFAFESEEALRDAIIAQSEIKKMKVKDYENEALNILESADVETQVVRNMIMKLTHPKQYLREDLSKLRKEATEKVKAIIKKRRVQLYQKERSNKLIKSIKHRLSTKGLKWGYQDKIADLEDGLVLKKVTKKERQSLEDFGKWVKDQQDEGIDLYANSAMLADLGKRYVYEMSEAELRELDKTIQSVVHQGRVKNKLIRRIYERTIDQISNAIGVQIRRGKPPGKPPVDLGIREKGWKEKGAGFHRELVRMERFLEHATPMGRTGTLYQQVWLATNDSYNNYVVNREAKKKGIEDILRIGRPDNNAFAKEVTPVDINDHLSMSPNSYKMAYIYSLTKKGRQHLIEGNNLTEQDLKDIEKKLTAHDRVDIERILDVMERYYPEINDIHRKIYGVDLARLPAYFHLFTRGVTAREAAAENMTQILTSPTYVAQALEKGMLKPRKGGRSALVLDFWGNTSTSIDIFEKYKAMALAERDVRKIINHSDVKQSITSQFGEEWYNELQDWFGDVYGKPKYQKLTWFEKGFRTLRLNAPISLLYMNATVPIRQTGSLALGISEVGLKDALPSMQEYVTNTKEIDAAIYEKDPVQKFRRVERDIAEIISKYKATHIRGLAGGESVFEFGIKPVIFFDRRTSNCVWWMAYKKSLAMNYKKITDPVLLEKKAIEDAQYVVRKTQPAWTQKDLSVLFRSKNELARALTMFQNFPNQIYNYVVEDSFKAYKNGEITKMELGTHLLWSIAVGSLLYGLSRRWRRPTEKEFWSDLLLYPLGVLPIGRDFTSVIQNKYLGKQVFTDFSLPPFICLNAALQAFGAKTPIVKAKYAFRALAYGAGMPGYAQAYRTFRGAQDMIRGETRDLRRLFISEYALEKPKPVDKVKVLKDKRTKIVKKWEGRRMTPAVRTKLEEIGLEIRIEAEKQSEQARKEAPALRKKAREEMERRRR